MFVSMNWINEYVDLSGLNIEELIHRFTLSTAEVEDIYYKGNDIKNVVAGKVALGAKLTEETLSDLPQLVAEIKAEIINRIGLAEEEGILRVLPYLSEWERVVLYGLTECKSYRKFAKFFGIGDFVARETISDIRARMKDLLKRNF